MNFYQYQNHNNMHLFVLNTKYKKYINTPFIFQHENYSPSLSPICILMYYPIFIVLQIEHIFSWLKSQIKIIWILMHKIIYHLIIWKYILLKKFIFIYYMFVYILCQKSYDHTKFYCTSPKQKITRK